MQNEFPNFIINTFDTIVTINKLTYYFYEEI